MKKKQTASRLDSVIGSVVAIITVIIAGFVMTYIPECNKCFWDSKIYEGFDYVHDPDCIKCDTYIFTAILVLTLVLILLFMALYVLNKFCQRKQNR